MKCFIFGLLFSAWAQAQSVQLLVIDAWQFYPAAGYPSAVSNRTVSSNFSQLIFQADSGRIMNGQLTIRCWGGYEYRNIRLYSGSSTASINNPCGYNQAVNFDLYLVSPLMAGSSDRVRVYGYGSMYPPPPPPNPGSGDLITNISFNRFYVVPGGYMGVSMINLTGGYSLYRFTSSDPNRVSGKVTVRCGGREYRNIALSPSSNGSIFVNPCDRYSHLNVDIYLTSPRVGAGTYGQIRIYGQR